MDDYSAVGLVVVVGAKRDSLTANEARLLLHDAADALSRAGGPYLAISCPFVDPDEGFQDE